MVGIGRAFDWGDISASWRYIGYGFKQRNLIRSASYSDPTIGLTWRF